MEFLYTVKEETADLVVSLTFTAISDLNVKVESKLYNDFTLKTCSSIHWYELY